MFNESHLMQQHGKIKVNIHSRQPKERQQRTSRIIICCQIPSQMKRCQGKELNHLSPSQTKLKPTGVLQEGQNPQIKTTALLQDTMCPLTRIHEKKLKIKPFVNITSIFLLFTVEGRLRT